MEAQLVADRTHLRSLLLAHLDWPYQELPTRLGTCATSIKRWVKRLRNTPADDEAVLWNRSSVRYHHRLRSIRRDDVRVCV